MSEQLRQNRFEPRNNSLDSSSDGLKSNPKSIMPPPMQLMATHEGGESGEGDFSQESEPMDKTAEVIGGDGDSPSASNSPNSGAASDPPTGDPIGDYSRSQINWTAPLDPQAFNESDVATEWEQGSYWYRAFSKEFRLGYTTTEESRFAIDEERDAVFSQVIANKPSPPAGGALASPVTKYLSINLKRPDVTDKNKLVSIRVYYSVEYTNAPKPGDSRPQHLVNISFLEESVDPKATIDAQNTSGLKVEQDILTNMEFSQNDASFPGGSVKSYFANDAGARQQVGEFLQVRYDEFKKGGEGGGKLDETLTVKEKGGGSVQIKISARFSKTNGVVAIESIYLAEPSIDIDPSVFEKDVSDESLDDVYKANPTSNRRMGKVEGLADIPENERIIVKHAAVTIFKYPMYADTEVDQVLPIKDPANPSNVRLHYYTFRVHPESASHVVDFTVRRIGVKGVDFKDPTKASIAGAFGYSADFTADQLKAWLLKRYPLIAAQVSTLTDKGAIVSMADKMVDQESTTKNWFVKNYGINPLTVAEALTALSAKDVAYEPAQKVGLKEFSAIELKAMEMSLQKLSNGLLTMLKGMKVIRQIDIINPKSKPASKAAGLHLGGRKIIILDDSAYQDPSKAESGFFGGKEGISSSDTGTVTHEFGHEIGEAKSKVDPTKTIQAMYNSFLVLIAKDFKYKAVGVTDYARETNPGVSSPETEAFPEIFKLYCHDPEWVRVNRPPEFFWMDYLNKKGADPAYSVIKPEIQKIITGN